MIRSRTTKRTSSQAFTLVELIVSIAIFGIMTALVVAKYGTFNNSVLLTNAAYDVAGAIRTAQTYGLSVKSTGTTNFNKEYVIDFNARTVIPPLESCAPIPSQFTLWTNSAYASSTRPVPLCADLEKVSDYILSRGAIISSVCAGTDPNNCQPYGRLVIRFLRPDPEARFGVVSMHDPSDRGNQNYARITLRAADSSTRGISIYKNGQISVDN